MNHRQGKGCGPWGWRGTPAGWGQSHGGQHPPEWAQGWHARQRFFFARIVIMLGLLFLLVAGGVTLLSRLVNHIAGNSGHPAFLGWVVGCGLALFLPLLVFGLGARAWRNVALPVTDMLAAVDAVAAGDLSVRVPPRNGEFRRLTTSFNHMIEELERTDRQRRNLAADVAHELRTPIHIIQGNLEGVLDGVYAPTPEHIEATLEETRQLARLVEDLRTLSLAESGELPLLQETVDVPDLLADVATSFSAQAEAAGIELCVTTGAAAPVVMGDAGRLDQVLSNLVANAIRHTPRGGKISLTAEYVGTRVRIAVGDNGEGIAAEDLPFIFDRFWRADRARGHGGGAGSGLGLAIANQLIHAHHGEITVVSAREQGTTFTILLPGGGTTPVQIV